MVFRYKIKTQSPRRPGLSPRKKSPGANVCNVSSYLSQLINTLDYDSSSSDFAEYIPEREWKILAALARKREEDIEREKLADQYRQLWQKEKQERKIVEQETLQQYNRYIAEKRRDEKSRYEHMKYQKSLESQLKREVLMDSIRSKEERSAELLACIDHQKTGIKIDKTLEFIARAQFAADRRVRMDEAEQFRKHLELIDTQRKADDAMMRRAKILKDASKRVAINNALYSWESSLIRQEVIAMDEARRVLYAEHAALTEARSIRLMRARDARRHRGKRISVVTEQLREVIRSSR